MIADSFVDTNVLLYTIEAVRGASLHDRPVETGGGRRSYRRASRHNDELLWFDPLPGGGYSARYSGTDKLTKPADDHFLLSETQGNATRFQTIEKLSTELDHRPLPIIAPLTCARCSS